MKNFYLILIYCLVVITTAKSQDNCIYVRIKATEVVDNRSPLANYEALVKKSSEFANIASKFSIAFENAFDFTNEKWLQMHDVTFQERNSSQSIKNLERIFKLKTSKITKSELNRLIKSLEATNMFDYVTKVSLVPTPPPSDIAPTTPNLEPEQTYIGPDPGLNMEYAWNQGIYGQGIRIRDCEYGVNVFHEDLEDQPISIFDEVTVSNEVSADFTEHGTAVFGILMAHNGGYGVTGLVNQASEGILFPEWTTEHGYDRIRGVSEAIDHSRKGDFIIYEMQTSASDLVEGIYVPAEYNRIVWDLTRAATDLGIIIVAAAGNGSQDLDSPLYNEYNSRGNSGAIIVGAGNSTTEHDRGEFSTYGSRVDLQAWGGEVLSTGYGDEYTYGNDFNQQYTQFAGTSSATPLVASCAIILQSYYFAETGDYLTAEELLTILETTGIPQGVGLPGNIGPFPNMKEALLYLQASLKTDSKSFYNLVVYPNPASEVIYVKNNNLNLTARLFNSSGQQIITKSLSNTDSKLDVSQLKSGIYFLELNNTRNNNKTIYKPIVIK